MVAGAVVLDSSAVLAWVKAEEGGGPVAGLLSGAAISAANWSEVLQKTAQWGLDAYQVGRLIKARGVRVEALTEADAAAAARFWDVEASLSLGDRCCLALAERLSLVAVSADREWGVPALAEAGVTVRLIR